jgi:hypothetical protein
MRMARRVSAALKDVSPDEDVTLEVVNADDVILGSPAEEGFRGDFVISVSDVRVRMALLVEQGPDALEAESAWLIAQRILWSNPDSASCLLVADDAVLTSLMIEPGVPTQSTLHSSSHRTHNLPQPVATAMRAFLREVVAVWPVDEFERVAQSADLSYESEVRDMTRKALGRRKDMRATIPERRDARQSLTRRDEQWVENIADAIMRGESPRTPSL